ncbi:MAG TPA: MFS transporter [Pseudolabrys sp.]|nr:MFS transporter [Pseudolabrys sp.]
MSAPSPRLLKQRPFILLWLSRVASTMGYQMLALVVGWKIYEITGSAFDLGLVGLIQFVPAVVLTLLIGHAADRYDRRLIVRIAQGVHFLAALTVLYGLTRDTLTRDLLFVAVFLIGCARSFEVPTAHVIVPTVVPELLIPRAVAAWTSANQTSVICGPALGGLLYALSPTLVCALCLGFFALAIALVTCVRVARPPALPNPPTFASVLAGWSFVRGRSRLLGVILLDLFVILLGGATALLPVYARDILAVGPSGLGMLRSAPAIGALLITIVLSRHPIERHVGPAMFTVVGLFGCATMVFGLSTYFPLSLVALAILGASDAVSVVLRFSLVQIETPDPMRGRVSAINYLFVGTSNTLGEFESGALAALIGTVPAVFIGGLGSVLVALTWFKLFPDLWKVDRFEPAK